MKKLTVITVLLLGFCSFQATVSKRDGLFPAPVNFPAPVYKFENNSLSTAGFELGRKLFYEPRLSKNNTISCGTCHIQASAFTHHGHEVSHGIEDRLGSRNSPPIMNLAWSTHFFWDGGVFDLDLQPIAPITNHVEMDESVAHVLEKLQAIPLYRDLFRKAFGSEDITTARMMKAMSQYMVMCISSNSRYDHVMRQEGISFTPEEASGYKLFKDKCNSCHSEPLFTDNSFRNNGLPPGWNDDKGRYQITLDKSDEYRFKVPSLRNVEFTAPYMHDGRFSSLNAVLDHYSEHLDKSQFLDPLLLKESPGMKLSLAERASLVAFLKALSDRDFLTNPMLSEQ